MWGQSLRTDVSELPLFRYGVQARRDDLEIGRAIVPRARIALSRPCALKIDTGLTECGRLAKNILAFNHQRPAVLISNEQIGSALNIKQLAVGYSRRAYQCSSQMFLSNPTAYCHLEPPRIGNEFH